MALRVVANQTYLGQQVQNTFVFDGTDAVVANGPTICDAIAEAWITHLLSRLSGEWVLNSFSYRDATAAPGTPYAVHVPSGLPINGSNSENPLPPFCSVLVSYSTGTVPPYRGRTYLAGWGRNLIDSNGQANTTTRGVVEDFYNDLADMSDFGLADITHVILSGTSPNYPANIPAPILSVTVRPDIATQRRRMRGRGS